MPFPDVCSNSQGAVPKLFAIFAGLFIIVPVLIPRAYETHDLPATSMNPSNQLLTCDEKDGRRHDSSPFKELLCLHEQTILGNCAFIDVLEKEACIVGTDSRDKLQLSPYFESNREALSSGISPIEHSDPPTFDSYLDSPSSSKSPILSGPRIKRKRRSSKMQNLSIMKDTSFHSEQRNNLGGLGYLNSLASNRRSLDFSRQPLSIKCTNSTSTDKPLGKDSGYSPDVFEEKDEFNFDSPMEDERPWEYSVCAPKLQSQSGEFNSLKTVSEETRPANCPDSLQKTPKSDAEIAGKSCQISPLENSDKHKSNFVLKGICKLINNTAFRIDQGPDQFLTGLSLIDWDESMLLNRDSVLDDSPKSIPFSEKFHQQLLRNNQRLLTPKQPTVISSSPLENTSFFGLPVKVRALFQNLRGIQDLYDWQKSCLNSSAVVEKSNLVYALPTSGGKTLVAEILLLREILNNRKNCIFILPFVSIVQEKVRALSQLAVELDFHVEEYAGGKGCFPPRKRRCKNTVYVATIEKALGLIHCLIMNKRLHEVGMVVVDELHLLGEGSRGAVLEAALTELIFSRERIQIIGMSATIGNLEEIAAFLNAKTFTGDFRPVELHEYIKCGSTIYSVNRNNIGTDKSPLLVERTVFAEYNEKQLLKDPDQIGLLVGEVVPDGSCLIFCPSRKNCENVSVLICETLAKSLVQIRCEEKKALFKALAAEGNGAVCPVLRKTLPYGVAYHHSGLTTAERRLLEEAFLANTICVICCTSTLAAGVNLPAKRVILRSPYIGTDFIDLSRYKQMVGRAGRTGFGEIGESILLCNFYDSQKVMQLLTSSMNESLSSLAVNECSGMKSLIMSSVSLAQATSRSAIYNLVQHTLLWTQAEKLGVNVVELADKCIKELVTEGAFHIGNETSSSSEEPSETIYVSNPQSDAKKGGDQLIPIGLHSKLSLSRVGEAAVKGSLSMPIALRLYGDLKTAQEKLVLLNHLHLLFIVTPYSMIGQIKTVNQVFFNVYMSLDSDEVKAATVVGITEAVVIGLARGRPVRTSSREVIDRFYLTLILHDLWGEKSVWDVATKYQVPRGQVHSLLVAASAFTSSVLRFSEALEEFWCFKTLLVNMAERLSHCCSVELLPLMELPSVKIGRARQLYNAGFRSLMDVANADPLQLVRELDHMPRKTAYQIVAASKLLLLDKAEALREQASDVLDGLVLQVNSGFVMK